MPCPNFEEKIKKIGDIHECIPFESALKLLKTPGNKSRINGPKRPKIAPKAKKIALIAICLEFWDKMYAVFGKTQILG